MEGGLLFSKKAVSDIATLKPDMNMIAERLKAVELHARGADK